MDCYQHPGIPPAATCSGCKQPICSACSRDAGGHPMCASCLAKHHQQFGGEILASSGARGTSVVDGGTDIKSQILQCIPTYIEFQRADPKKYPLLDVAAVERYTSAYEGLGFQGLAAYEPKTNAKELTTGYARLFAHPEKHCWAEVNQAFPNEGDPSPVRSVVMSALDQGWTLSTTDRKADWTTWMLRRPRSLWASLPDAPAQTLFERHLQDRQRMIERLGLPAVDDLSMQSYCDREVADNLARRKAVEAKSVFSGLVDCILFKYFPKTEWWGDSNKARRK